MATMNMAQALNSAMDVMLQRDPDVLVFGEDVGFFGGVFRVTEGLQQRYGDARVFDAPIAEGPIRDRVFRWPDGATPLTADTAFELTLLPARAGDRAVTTRFSTPAIAAPAGQEPLVVITVD